MKQCNKFLALVLAMIMIFSNANLGLTLAVSAAEIGTGSESVTTGELLQEQYGISDAEVALVDNYLQYSNTYRYDMPTNELVEIDPVAKSVTVAMPAGGWTINSIELVPDGADPIVLGNAAGTYTYTCDTTFFVRVSYKLPLTVENQDKMLSAAAELKAAKDSLYGAYDSVWLEVDGTLYDALDIIRQAMPLLKVMAEGVTIDLGFLGSETYGLEPEAVAAYEALAAQIAANKTAQNPEGELTLHKENAILSNLTALEYLANSTADYWAVFAETQGFLEVISQDELLNQSILDSWVAHEYPDDANVWKTFKVLMKMLSSGMDTANSTNKGNISSLKSGLSHEQFVGVEALVDSIVPTEGITIVDTLVKKFDDGNGNLVDYVLVEKTQGMKTVTVNVVINTLVNNELVKKATYTASVNKAVGTDKATIDGVVQGLVDAWLAGDGKAAYEAEPHQEAVVETTMGDSLTDNVTYTYTIDPVKYDVKINGAVVANVYHGYKYALPVHADVNRVYDYTIGSEHYYQGEVITIIGLTEITQVDNEAYEEATLFGEMANQFAQNQAAIDILTSGALKGDMDILYRFPGALGIDVATLSAGKLTFNPAYAATVPSDFQGHNWVLNYYGDDKVNYAVSGTTAEFLNQDQAYFQYILALDGLDDEVAVTLATIAELQADANAQKSILGSLYAYYDNLKLLSQKPIIDLIYSYMKDTEFDADPAVNAEILAHFETYLYAAHYECVDLIDAMKVDSNGNGPADLLYHYYSTSAIKTAVDNLSYNLDKMLNEKNGQANLTKFFDQQETNLKGLLPASVNYDELKDMLPEVSAKIGDINDKLEAPNTAVVDLESANLLKLTNALQAKEAAKFAPAGTLELKTQPPVVVEDASTFNIRVYITVDGKTQVPISLDKALKTGDKVTANHLQELQTKIANVLNANVHRYESGDAKYFYDVVGSIDLPAADTVLSTIGTQSYNVSYTLKTFDVMLDGAVLKTITVKDLGVILPAAEAGVVRTYTVNGKEATPGVFFFKEEDLKGEFGGDGIFEITYTEIDEREDKLIDAFGDSEVIDLWKDDSGKYHLDAVVSADKAELMAFGQELVLSGYTQILMNGEPLFTSTTDDGMVLSVQTLINAILADETFGSQKLIALGLGNPLARSADNTLLTTTISLGDDKGIHYADLPFTLSLDFVPAKLTQLAEALKAVEGYLDFRSAGDRMDVSLNLPEKVYEAYLAAMVAAGYKTNDDITDVNMQIAYAYLCDAIEVFADSSVTVETFQAYLDKLHIDRDITKFGPYMNKMRDLINNGTVSVVNNTDSVAANVVAQNTQINKLLSMLGYEIPAELKALVTIKELDLEGGFIAMNSQVSVVNAPIEYEAIILDANALKAGVKEFTNGVEVSDLLDLSNGVDFTENLIARLNGVGASAIMLLSDVTGDLEFNGTTILDLNGKKITGNIHGNGTVLIIDSNLAADNCGTVDGTLSGNVVVVAGKYTDDNVTSFLADGYKVEDGYVHNAMYTVEGDFENLHFIINTDFMHDEAIKGYVPSVKGMAADILADLILNRFVYASISYNDKVILDLGLESVLTVLDKEEPAEFLINELLNLVNIENATGFMNELIAELLDFGTVAENLKNGNVVASYKLTACPWTVKLHNDNGLDLDIVANTNRAHELNMSLSFVGENTDKLVKIFEHLDAYVDASAALTLKQPIYNDRTLYLAGEGHAKVDINLTANKQWQTLIAVIMAYGNPDQADAWVNAIGDEAALKAIFNASTVEEVFTALKAMNHKTSFAEMAESLGVELDAPGRESLENLYHLALTGFGKGLEKLDITGFTDKTMGMLEINDTGVYGMTVDAHKHPDASFRGWTLDVDALLNTTGITVKIFDYEEPELMYGTIASKYWTMSLDSVVYLNYYVNMTGFDPNLDFASKGGVVVWTGNENPTNRDQVQIGLENCDVIEGMFYDENHGWGVQSPEIYAKNLGDRVYLRAYVEIAEGIYVYGPVGYYSPEAYCKDMLKNSNEREDTRAVCAALLNYGASAQIYFGYKTDALVTDGVDLSKYDLSFKSEYLDAMDLPSAAMANTLEGIKAGITFGEATLNLQGAIRLDVGYVVDPSIHWDDVASAEVLFWTEDAYNNADSLAYSLNNYVYKEALVAGTVDGTEYMVAQSQHILAKYLSDTIYFSARIVMNDGTVYRSGLGYYSPEQFVADHLAQSEGQIVTVCENIAVYSEMARIRFAQ